MKNKVKKTIASIGVATAIATGGVVIDNATVTDAEIKSSIDRATTEGKIPMIDISKVSLERISKGYIAVAVDNGVSLSENQTDKNVYELIRKEKVKKGKNVLPETKETLLVK